MKKNYKIAQQVIDAWVTEGDVEAPLDLDQFNTIPELPKNLKILYADSATSLPELPKTLTRLFADSAITIPKLSASLEILHANNAITIPSLPKTLTVLRANSATTLPNLPVSLIRLSAEKAANIVNIPEKLETLCISHATRLPEIPASLIYLYARSDENSNKLNCYENSSSRPFNSDKNKNHNADLPVFIEKKSDVKDVKDVKDESLDLISLFSGAGGMDIGFEKAGFKIVWANERDKTITPSYKKYFTKTKVDERSIRSIPDRDIPKNIKGVIGSPPVHSTTESFFESLRVIKCVKPDFFVMENVQGLIQSGNKDAFDKNIELFEGEGYVVSWKLIKASDYGVPQDRVRVFIVGYHRSLNKTFKFPEPLKTKTTLREAIGDLDKLKIGSTNKVKNHEFINSGYSPMFMSRNRVRSWDEQSYTILPSERHIPFHPKAPKMIKVKDQDLYAFPKDQENKYRRLTIRECARIQTFPDNYEFIYTHMKNGYKMVGNATSIDLAYWIAKTIKSQLEESNGL